MIRFTLGRTMVIVACEGVAFALMATGDVSRAIPGVGLAVVGPVALMRSFHRLDRGDAGLPPAWWRAVGLLFLSAAEAWSMLGVALALGGLVVVWIDRAGVVVRWEPLALVAAGVTLLTWFGLARWVWRDRTRTLGRLPPPPQIGRLPARTPSE